MANDPSNDPGQLQSSPALNIEPGQTNPCAVDLPVAGWEGVFPSPELAAKYGTTVVVSKDKPTPPYSSANPLCRVSDAERLIGERDRAILALADRLSSGRTFLDGKSEGSSLIKLIERLRSQRQPLEPVIDEFDLEDMARSALEEGLSFGVNLDVFMRLARRVMNATQRQLEAEKTHITEEVVATAPGLHAVRFRNNWDGQGDIEMVFATFTDKGVWVNEDGKPLIEYEGDKILQAWPLVSETPSVPDAECIAFLVEHAGDLHFLERFDGWMVLDARDGLSTLTTGWKTHREAVEAAIKVLSEE